MTRQNRKRRREIQRRRRVADVIVQAAIEATPDGGNVVEYAEEIGKKRFGDLATFMLIMKLVIEILQLLYAHDEDNLITDID